MCNIKRLHKNHQNAVTRADFEQNGYKISQSRNGESGFLFRISRQSRSKPTAKKQNYTREREREKSYLIDVKENIKQRENEREILNPFSHGNVKPQEGGRERERGEKMMKKKKGMCGGSICLINSVANLTVSVIFLDYFFFYFFFIFKFCPKLVSSR